MKKFTLCIFLCTAFFPSVKGQWTTDTNLNTEVKDSAGTEESVPLSATTSGGQTFVSYFAQYNGSYEMRLQLLDVQGNRLFGNGGLLVSNQPQSTALYRYDMKVDADDNAIIAFQDERTGGNLHVVVYKIDIAGNFLWGANGIQLIDTASTQGLGPAIGITNASNVVIGWNANASSYKWVAFQKISSSGIVQWNDNMRIYDGSFTHKYSRPTFAAAGTDDFTMLYAEETGNGLPPSVMFAQRYDGNGNNVWPNAVQVSAYTIPFFFFPEAISDNNDGFFVGFNTSNISFPTQGDVYMQHVDAGGTLWNPTGNLACALPNTQKFTASVHFDETHNSSWVLIKTTDVNQGMSGAAIQAFDISGNVLLGVNAIQLAPIAAAYHDPNDFCITTDGVISFYTTGSYPSQSLQAVKNDFSGTLQWNGSPVDICTHLSGKDDLTAGLFANDQVIAVWDDNRYDYGVYAQNITNDGQAGVLTAINPNHTPGLSSVGLHPNPAHEYSILDFNTTESQEIVVEISNLIGERLLISPASIAGAGAHSVTINMAEFPAGFYQVKVSGTGFENVLQLIHY